MISESSENERFSSEKLLVDKMASFKLFKPGKNGRDHFGNRIFRSKSLAFIDREGEPIKAALLISPQGEVFIKSNRGILNDIDRGLREINALDRGSQDEQKRVDLDDEKTLSYFSRGGQSIVYLLETPDGKYIVKIKNPETKPYHDVTQPYINEMLQMQSFSKDLKEKLAELKLDEWDYNKGEWIRGAKSRKIEIPTYLFASGLIACLKFEEGEKPDYNKDIKPIVEPLYNLTRNYIDTKKAENDPLWNNLHTDLMNPPTIVGEKTSNFIKKPDGTLIWIDMFLYQPAWSEYEYLEIVKKSADQGDKEAKEIVERFRRPAEKS